MHALAMMYVCEEEDRQFWGVGSFHCVVNLRLSSLAVFTHKIVLPTPRLTFFIYIFNLK